MINFSSIKIVLESNLKCEEPFFFRWVSSKNYIISTIEIAPVWISLSPLL
jgi:hypothetical protein